MSPKQDLQFLRYILDEVLASPSAQAATYTDWGRGDFRRASGVVARIKQLYPELYEILVLDRNRKWGAALQEDAVGEEAGDGCSGPFPFGRK
jgi:uncharacterized protein YbaP (TraB family)